ncbi:MAG: hypothetical protein CMJ17_05545 [Phenylobacterium sp.]|nr:hypothetical protein [Phenylobacterium sp.]
MILKTCILDFLQKLQLTQLILFHLYQDIFLLLVQPLEKWHKGFRKRVKQMLLVILLQKYLSLYKIKVLM